MYPNPMKLDISYLRYPEHQTMFLLDETMLDMIFEQVTFMYRNLQDKDWIGTANNGFDEPEAEKFKRIHELCSNSIQNKNDNIDSHRIYLVKFVDEHDLRRGTNFLETFPEMKNFYYKCKELNK
jgi:hypothetical protein